MSRVHEAMQRAASASPDAAGPQRPLPALPDAATTGPNPDSFPSETTTRASADNANADPAAGPVDSASPPADWTLEQMDASFAEKVVTDQRMAPVNREQYRRLAAVLRDARESAGASIIMVASAVAGEGKTLTACNLALTLSESYRNRVLLIDADLRKPTLQRVFHINSAGGLTDGLEAPAAKLVLQQVSPRLTVLPGGRPRTDPMASLTSRRMRQLLAEAKQTFDWVIIDTPPLVLLPDAHLLAAMVDGAVLVIKAHSTPHNLVMRAVDTIGSTRVLGTVLNQARVPSAGVYPYYSDEYGSRELPGATSTS